MCGRVCLLSGVKGGVERCGVCHEKSARWRGGGGCWRGSCYVRDGCLFVFVAFLLARCGFAPCEASLWVARVFAFGVSRARACSYWRGVGEGVFLHVANNFVLVCLQGALAAARSKPHSAFLRPLGSRFTGSSVAQPGRLRGRLTAPPRAFNVSGALPATQILIAAFKSRSIARPQPSQWNTRSDRDSLAFTAPHFEQVLLLGYQRSTTCSAAPLRVVLYSNCLRNSPNAASEMDLAR